MNFFNRYNLLKATLGFVGGWLLFPILLIGISNFFGNNIGKSGYYMTLTDEPQFAAAGKIIYPIVSVTFPENIRTSESGFLMIEIRKGIYSYNAPGIASDFVDNYVNENYEILIKPVKPLGFRFPEKKEEKKFSGKKEINWRYPFSPEKPGKFEILIEGLPLTLNDHLFVMKTKSKDRIEIRNLYINSDPFQKHTKKNKKLEKENFGWTTYEKIQEYNDLESDGILKLKINVMTPIGLSAEMEEYIRVFQLIFAIFAAVFGFPFFNFLHSRLFPKTT